MSNLIERRNRIREAVPHLATASGSIASFQTDMRSALEEIKIHFNPLQAAGTPSPTSPIPIYGWTGCDLSECGKNLFDVSTMPTAREYINQAGQVIHEDSWRITQYIKISGTITYSGLKYTGNAPYSAWYDANKNLISTFKQQVGVITVTPPSGAVFVRFSVSRYGDDQDSLQVVSGSVGSDYESYVGNQIPVSWSALGTVYGGWVNPVSGEVWADWEYGDMGDLTWDGASSNASSTYVRNKNWISAYGGASTSMPHLFIDQFNVVTHAAFNNNIGVSGHFATITSNGRFYFMSPDIAGYSYTQVIAYMVGKKYAIKLDTPQLVGTISPITLKTLIGTNNIWSNANGDVDVKYWKH